MASTFLTKSVFIKIHCFITHADTFYGDILILIKSLTGSFMKSKGYSLLPLSEKEKRGELSRKIDCCDLTTNILRQIHCAKIMRRGCFLLCRTIIQMQALKQKYFSSSRCAAVSTLYSTLLNSDFNLIIYSCWILAKYKSTKQRCASISRIFL